MLRLTGTPGFYAVRQSDQPAVTKKNRDLVLATFVGKTEFPKKAAMNIASALDILSKNQTFQANSPENIKGKIRELEAEAHLMDQAAILFSLTKT